MIRNLAVLTLLYPNIVYQETPVPTWRDATRMRTPPFKRIGAGANKARRRRSQGPLARHPGLAGND